MAETPQTPAEAGAPPERFDDPWNFAVTWDPERGPLYMPILRLFLHSPTITPGEAIKRTDKGHATYWSLAGDRPGGRDLAWTYRAPLHDAAAVKDHVAFYNERVDLTVDGDLLVRPRTPWSSPAVTKIFSPVSKKSSP